MDEFFSPKDPDAIRRFNALLEDFYKKKKRVMPWRDEITPFRIVVSEIMLQQTQVPRVIQKFPEFIDTFPDFKTLAGASLEEVLRVWQGLGYNRRAKYIRQIAQEVLGRWDGVVPDDPLVLKTLPGIGPATAGSIVAFAYNRPVIFIETNIRRVFIHHFFHDASGVSDKEIYPVITRTLNKDHVRDWYYSLMDYGTCLAGKVENPNRKSRHYAVQSPFVGSDREIRGRILKILLEDGPTDNTLLVEKTGNDGSRVGHIMNQMIMEGFVIQDHNLIRFP